ncbi:MAG TPA: class I SAM-dependent methyltransferase [bacterium]
MKSEIWEEIWAKDTASFHDLLFDPYTGIENCDYLPHVKRILSTTPGLILEAGCGQGGWLEWLGNNHERPAVGLDYAEQALSRLRRLRPSFLLVGGDVLSMPFADRSFSVVLSWGVIEHFYDLTLTQSAIREAYRVLKPSGWLCVTVPVQNWIRSIKRPYRMLKDLARVSLGRVDLKKEFFEHKFDRAFFIKMLRSNGFLPEVVGYNSPGFGLTNEFPFDKLRKVSKNGAYAGVTRLGGFILHLTKRYPQIFAHMLFVAARKP